MGARKFLPIDKKKKPAGNSSFAPLGPLRERVPVSQKPLDPGFNMSKSRMAAAARRLAPADAAHKHPPKDPNRVYIPNPDNKKSIFLKNHPVLASMDTVKDKTRFLSNHPKIAARAKEITVANKPALSKPATNQDYREAAMRRLKDKNLFKHGRR